MEGVLDATLRLCVCKLMSSVLLCPSVVTHTITAVSLCCCCLLFFTDLAVTLFLLYVRLMESWLTPFYVSSDVIALRFLLFLSQAYGVVLLLTPPLIAVELFVNLLRPREGRTKGCLEQNESDCVSRTVGCFGCLLAWIVSGICSSRDWTLERFSVEACLKRGGCLVTCVPDMDELSWVIPALVVLLSLTGSLGRLRSRSPPDAQMGKRKDYAVLGQMHASQNVADSEKTPNGCCGVHRTGCVYSEQRRPCPGNDVPCAHQTGLADNYIPKKKQPAFAQSKTDLLLEVTSTEQCVFNKFQGKRCWPPERENPCLWRETFTGLVCVLLVCAFPTVISGNILLIFNLENLVAHSLKLLSQRICE